MQVLILYCSRCGNTKGLAQFVAEKVDPASELKAFFRTFEKLAKEGLLHSSSTTAGSLMSMTGGWLLG